MVPVYFTSNLSARSALSSKLPTTVFWSGHPSHSTMELIGYTPHGLLFWRTRYSPITFLCPLQICHRLCQGNFWARVSPYLLTQIFFLGHPISLLSSLLSKTVRNAEFSQYPWLRRLHSLGPGKGRAPCRHTHHGHYGIWSWVHDGEVQYDGGRRQGGGRECGNIQQYGNVHHGHFG